MEASQGGHSTKIGGGIPGWSQYKDWCRHPRVVTVQRLVEASQGGHSTKIGGGIPGWSQYKD